MAIILDGKALAAELQKELRGKVSLAKPRKPCLAFILVGENSAAKTYVKMKKRACTAVGIEIAGTELPDSASEEKILDLISRYNQNPIIDGILVQLPLPSHVDTQKVMLAIDPTKDVDGFHPLNIGKMLLGQKGGFFSCTPLGIKILMEKYDVPVAGKHAVIIGRSNIVGKPMAAILMQNAPGCNASVTVLHRGSENIAEITKTADILIVAAGDPKMITGAMIKQGSTIIDVGTNRQNGRLVGDVDFDSCKEKAAFISPVPGGVGPMTIAMLLKNTYESYLNHNI